MSGGTLTRILNNQIYSKTIVASQKIADGTITGSLFSSNITIPGDFLITGNLFVLGTSAYTTVASTNTYVNDPLIVLNNGFAGTNTYDEGFVFNRGSLQNRALIWSEFYQEFRLIGTTETGTTYGNVTASNFANLHIGNLIVDYATSTGSFFTSGFINTGGNISGAVGNFGSINSTGFINTSGNVSAAVFTGGQVSVTGLINTAGNVLATGAIFNALTVNGNETVTGYLNVTGNVLGATASFGAINSTGFINTSGNVSAAVFTGGAINTAGNVLASSVLATLVQSTSGTFGNVAAGFIGNTGTAFTGASINVSGNVDASSVLASFITASTAAVGNISAVTIGNTGATITGTTGAFSGNVIGGLAQFAAINNTVIGNATPAAGTFTTLNATGNVLGAAATFNSSQINGNESVTGYLNVTGNILGSAGTLNTLALNSTANATEGAGASGALQIKGGVSIAQDLWVGGNLYAANIIGISANVITVQDPLLYLRPASIFPYNYDIGFYSGFQGVGLATANVYQHTAVFRDPLTNTWTFASNLAEPSASYITLDATTIYDPIKAGNLNLVNTTASTTTGTGALIVAGGAGIAGAVTAGSFNTAGNVDAATVLATLVQATSGTFGNVASGFIGNTGTAYTGASINLSGNILAAAGVLNALTVNGGITSTGFINTSANISGAVVTASTVNASGNVVASTVLAQLVTADDATFGNVAALFVGNTGTQFTGASINLSGNILAAAGVLNALTVNGGITSTGYINTSANISGAVINTATLNAATLTATGNVIGGLANFASINNTPIGNATASTGAFTTLSASAGIWANSTTDTSSLTTGALIVAGGTAVGKRLWTGEGAVLNSTGAAEVLQFYGQGSNGALIYADAAKNAITFSTKGNATVQSGVIAKFDSTGAIILPAGATASRPGSAGNVDIQGMLRYNTTINNMEFYDGSTWQTAGSTFTVISDRQFSGNTAGGYGNVDGSNTAFTLQANSTTAGTLVSINGVLQFPTLAYSVSGASLTFTEPPAPGDVIDARIIVTTSQVTSLASATGYNQFIADNTGVSLWTGSSVSAERLLIDTGGNINVLAGSKITYDQTVVSIPNTNLTLLDSFSANAYTTAKYVISMKQGTGNVQAMEALLTQSTVGSTAGTAYVTTYGIINTGNTMGTLAANVDVSGSWTVNMYLIPNAGTAISNVKVMTTYIV